MLTTRRPCALYSRLSRPLRTPTAAPRPAPAPCFHAHASARELDECRAKFATYQAKMEPMVANIQTKLKVLPF